MKVFIGLHNIASQFQDLKYGFEKNGCSVLVVSDEINTSPIINNYSDINLNIKYREWINFIRPRRIRNNFYNRFGDYRRKILHKCIQECDVFFFIWKTFYPSCEDLDLIKSRGKKIVALFVGDDVRWKPAMDQEFTMFNLSPIQYFDYNDSEDSLKIKLRYIRLMEKYADLIINTEDAAQLQTRPYLRNSRFLDLRGFRPSIEQRITPHIIHSPSNRYFKGTKYILEAIEKLNSENINFSFSLIENLSNKEALMKYAESDILIGQLFAPSGGKQDMEALASGTVVLTNNDQKYLKYSPLKYPIIHTDPSNILQVLRETIMDYEKRKKLAIQGVEFAQKHLNVTDFCKNIIDHLNHNGESSCFIEPTFLRDHYKPRNIWEIKLINESNKLVMNENWYRATITSKVRSKLVFL